MRTWLFSFLMNDVFFTMFAPCLSMGTFMKIVQLDRALLHLTGGIETSIIFKRIAYHLFLQSAIAFLYNYQFISWLFASTQPQFDIVRFHMKLLIRQPFYVKEGIEDPVYFVLTEIWEAFKHNPFGVEFFQSNIVRWTH